MDELYFCELHTDEFKLLKKNFVKNSNIKIINDDGFTFPNKIKIKKQKKGIILIDPSYEKKMIMKKL
jgi:23S rRNA (adenine2030-N6)-methyltransferase